MAKTKTWRRWLIHAVVIASLLVAVEIILRLSSAPPSFTRSDDSFADRFFVPESRDGAEMMVNNFRSEMESEGVPAGEPPPEGRNEALWQRVRDVMEFNREKPPDETRIFVLGTSPIWGFLGNREDDHTLLALYLRDKLRDRYPQVNAKVVNAAHVGMGGPEVLRCLREMVEYQPDLVVVYFGGVMPTMAPPVEDRGDLEKSPETYFLLRLLGHSKLFRAIRKALSPRSAEAQQPFPPPPVGRPPELAPTMGDIEATDPEFDSRGLPLFGPHSKPLEQPEDYDERLVNLVANLKSEIEGSYRALFEQMAGDIAQRGAAGVFFTVATNKADIRPFWSLHQKPISAADRKTFARLLVDARRRLDNGDVAGARRAYEQAVALGPTFAAARFELGRVYRQLGEHDKARAEFLAAKEWDASNERALDRPNDLLRHVAAAHGLATLNAEEIILAMPESEGYLGRGVFIDHQHMTPAVVRTMAEALSDRMPQYLPQVNWGN